MDALVVVMRRQISLRRWQPSCILGVRDTTILRAQCVEERKQRFSGKTFAELKKEEEDRERIEAEKEEQESPKQKIEDELKTQAKTGFSGVFGPLLLATTLMMYAWQQRARANALEEAYEELKEENDALKVKLRIRRAASDPSLASTPCQ